jgi:hypothetical protein
VSAANSQKVLPCGLHVSSEDVAAYRNLKCLVGTATAVSVNAMRVQPARGPARRFRFTENTQFDTDSGEGALNGLAVRDRVCVAYTGSAQPLSARIVAFSPRSNPCAAGKQPVPSPGDD